MMRAVPFAMLALLSSPVAAQQATPDQNLDCAVWSAYQIGIAQDDQVKNGLSIAIAWFIGQYEGQTGTLIDQPMAERTKALDEVTIAGFTGACVGRFANFGERLGNLGALLDQ